MEKLISRINELARKAKAEGLTVAEQVERQELRKQYVQSVTGNLKSQLEQIRIVDEEGNEYDLSKGKRRNDS